MNVIDTPTVVYEDNHLILVHKPGGMLVQGDDTGDPHLISWVQDYLIEKYQKPGSAFCGLIHRIDRPVSGLVVLAKTSKGLERMNKLFHDRQVTKTYLAVVEGSPELLQAKLEHNLIKDAALNKSKVVSASHKQAKKAILNYETITLSDRYALLKVNLETGRHHQIRVQLSAIGHTIVGDLKYGAKRSLPDKGAIALHSSELSFVHPISGKELKAKAATPNFFPWTLFSPSI